MGMRGLGVDLGESGGLREGRACPATTDCDTALDSGAGRGESAKLSPTVATVKG